MRRTPLKRSTTPIARNVRLKAKRSKPRRVSVLRDRAYLDLLGQCRCVACSVAKLCYRDRLCASGLMPIDPAHGPVAGARMKGPDNEAIPLCRDHHDEQHRIGWAAFETKYGFSREKEAAAYWAAYQIWKEHTAV